jgi:hypothetical protein
MMQKYFTFISPTALIILTIITLEALFTSCNEQEKHDNVGKLTLASSMDTPAMRSLAGSSTVDNVWSGGEQVQVSIDNNAAVLFIAAQSGTLTPISPIYWQNSSQNISARAWYPAAWAFPTDQSAGLQPADFIFASTVTGISASNFAGKPLVFRHRTAKVTVNIRAGMNINSVSNATVAFYGYTAGVPNTSNAGNGAISGSGNGWITPQDMGNDTYTALLIPRDMTGIPFIKITLNDTDYLYTPSAGKATLQQGMAYVYNITIHETHLEVEVTDGIEWSKGDEFDVVPGM